MKHFFTLILVLVSLNIFAQETKTSIASTITYKSGKTEKVHISPDQIHNSKNLEYSIAETKEYQIANPQNVASIKGDDNSFILKTFNDGNDDYFLYQVVEGSADLFYYFNNSKNLTYLAYTEDIGYKKLENKKSSVNKDGREFNQNTKAYLGVLNIIFSDCKSDIDLKKIKLNLKSLAKAFTDYNECKNDLNFLVENLNKKTGFRIALLGGVDITSLKSNTPVANNAEGESNFTIGTEFSVIPAFFDSKLLPFVGLNYTKTEGKADYLSTPEFDELELNFEMIEVNLGMRYSLAPLSAKVNPFLGVSMSKSFILDHHNSILKVASDNSAESRPLYAGNPYKSLGSSMKLGLHFQAGVNYRITSNQGIILMADYSSMDESLGEFQFTRFKLQVGYFFNLN